MAKTTICHVCGKDSLAFNEVGLCKKLLGRNIENFFCVDCLAAYLEVTTEELLAKVDEFKAQGCALFR
jgi:hypothetical protein